MTSFLSDLRLALRTLRGKPGFVSTAVLTLMLGIGAVAAIFTVYDAVLLKPLPFTDPARLVRVMRTQAPVKNSPVSPPVFREWAERSGAAFEAIGAFVPQTVNLTGAGNAERLTGYTVTPGFWNVFGQPVALGRSFGDAEENANERVVVLGDALWRVRFGADPAVVGRDIQLNGESWRVIGVAAAAFRYPSDAQLWTPTFLPANNASRGSNSLAPIARLAPGVTLEQAREVMRGITDWEAETFPDGSAPLVAQVERLDELVGRGLRGSLSVLLGAALLVLLIACANLASLMLTRGQVREQELAVRSALGASHAQLMRNVLAEAFLLAGAGALAALLFAYGAVRALLRLAPDLLPAYNAPAIDLRVVSATTLVALATLILFGLAPAWRAGRADPALALRSGARGQVGNQTQARARGVLVAAEIALAMTLLSGAGLLIDSLRQLSKVDSGLRDPERVLTAKFSLAIPAMQPGEDFKAWYTRVKAVLEPRLDALQARLRTLPGVTSIAITNALPASGQGGWNGGFEIAGQEVPKDAIAEFRFGSPAYFSTFGIPLKAGRMFDESDGARALFPTEVLVSQTFVDRYLGGGDALGRQVTVFDDSPKTIVGVVGDVRQFGLDQGPDAEVWMPVRTVPVGNLALALKTDGDALALAPTLRRAVQESFPDVPLYAIRTMDEVTGETSRLRRFNMTLMSAFAACALALAAIGLYGVIAWIAAQRRREIGVRQSFGATRAHIHAMMLKSGLRMVVPGILAGFAGALAIGQLIGSQLFGVGSADPRVLAGVVAMLGLVALAACLIPSWRALRVAPMDALRND
ncbi:ABC transporter permease [Dokdonella sp.]|uniref:ABC transporter permease n=1 Tax=Dokdonella sp. TaxID=2291710 RepID=UPI001AFD097D|nr:ABC transporter permease [Dokdonella sp.]MBO9663909.1 ABC transporter permease [Dokdonella sp.]